MTGPTTSVVNAPTTHYEPTGRLGTLLPSLRSFDRGNKLIHAAEEGVRYYPHWDFTHVYVRTTALCGTKGWGAAELPLGDVTCARCQNTRRFREYTQEVS